MGEAWFEFHLDIK